MLLNLVNSSSIPLQIQIVTPNLSYFPPITKYPANWNLLRFFLTFTFHEDSPIYPCFESMNLLLRKYARDAKYFDFVYLKLFPNDDSRFLYGKWGGFLVLLYPSSVLSTLVIRQQSGRSYYPIPLQCNAVQACSITRQYETVKPPIHRILPF